MAGQGKAVVGGFPVPDGAHFFRRFDAGGGFTPVSAPAAQRGDVVVLVGGAWGEYLGGGRMVLEGTQVGELGDATAASVDPFDLDSWSAVGELGSGKSAGVAEAVNDPWADEGLDTGSWWSYTDDKKVPGTVAVEPTTSNAYGPPIFLQIQRGEEKLGVWLDLDTWENMYRAGLSAHEFRRQATERGWT